LGGGWAWGVGAKANVLQSVGLVRLGSSFDFAEALVCFIIFLSVEF